MIHRKILKVSSDDRDNSNESTANFTCSFSNTILQNVRAVALKQLTFRHLINNLNAGNNTLYIYSGLGVGIDIGDGTGYEANLDIVLIPEGQYNATELATVLTSTLNTQLAPNVFSVVLNSDDNYEISSSTTFIAILRHPENTLGRLMGFSEDLNITSVLLESQDLPQLSIPELYIHSSLSKSHCIDAKGYLSDQLTVIPITIAYGGVQSYNSPDIHSDLVVYKTKQDITSITITLKDSRGYILDLGNQEINLLFEIFF
jgi:hypothetical protein